MGTARVAEGTRKMTASVNDCRVIVSALEVFEDKRLRLKKLRLSAWWHPE